jgi:hypothetical protein
LDLEFDRFSSSFVPLLTVLCCAAMLQIVAGEKNSAYATSHIPDFNFVAVGDWTCERTALATMRNILDKDPEQVLGLGDYSYVTSADCWLKMVDPIDEKMKIAIGNHELFVNTHRPFNSYIYKYLLDQYMNHFNLTKQYYSFNYQNIHFLVMASEDQVRQGSDQYDFVRNDLIAASANSSINWIVAFVHVPMYSSHYQDPDLSTKIVEAYHPLFDKYGVDLVLQGHDHNYQRSYPLKYNPSNSSIPTVTSVQKNNYTNPSGQIYAIVGTGGVSLDSLRGQAPFIVTQQDIAHGILNIDMLNNGKTLKATFYANDGVVDDQFVINKTGTNNTSALNLTSVNVTNTTAGPAFAPYENSQLGIKIEYPVNWQQRNQGDPQSYPVFYLPPSNNSVPSLFERLHIYVYDSENRALDQVVSRDLTRYKEHLISNFTNTELSKNKTLLAGLPAYNLVYSGMEGPYTFKAIEFWTLKGDKVYNILYIAPVAQYDRNLPVVQKVIDSFKIIG